MKLGDREFEIIRLGKGELPYFDHLLPEMDLSEDVT